MRGGGSVRTSPPRHHHSVITMSSVRHCIIVATSQVFTAIRDELDGDCRALLVGELGSTTQGARTIDLMEWRSQPQWSVSDVPVRTLNDTTWRYDTPWQHYAYVTVDARPRVSSRLSPPPLRLSAPT